MRTTWIAAAALCFAAVASPVLVSPAMAQVNDDAKAVFTESAKAIKDAKGITFKVKTYATSILKDIIDLDGTVKLWRPDGASTLTWMVVGRAKDPGKPDRKLVITSDGTTVKWLDEKENKLFIRSVTDSNAMEASNMCKELVLPEWNSPTPYSMEMTNFPILEKIGITNVNGEVCDQVQAMPASKDRNRTWAISVKDRLPRQLELGTGNAAQKISKITDISELKTAKYTADDFKIALPNGYVIDEMKPEPARPIMPPQGETPVKAPDLGLKAGTPAPGFTATDSTGKDASLASMKGNVVVMEFWGTMFKASTANASEMKNLSGMFKTNTKFVALACRERDAKAATDWWSKSELSYPLITKGDAIATDYKVMGYPSYYVIDDKGSVAAFFQNFPGTDKLKAAIEAAGGK